MLLLPAQSAHGSSKGGRSTSLAAASAQECPEHQNTVDPAWRPEETFLQKQPISSCRQTIPSALATLPAQGHPDHESHGSMERQKSRSIDQISSGTPISADTAAQRGAQTGRSAPAGRCPTLKASDPKPSGWSDRPSAFAAAASAQEHTYLHSASPAAPQPASQEIQTQPRQTPFAAAALAQSSPRSAREVPGAPAASDASPWASAEAPAAMCVAAALRASSAGALRSPPPRQLSCDAAPSHDPGAQDGQRKDFLKALEEACRQGPARNPVSFSCCTAACWSRSAHG